MRIAQLDLKAFGHFTDRRIVFDAGNVGFSGYVSCRSFEMIQTESPDITISTCGVQSVTVKFLNTPKNTKHGKSKSLFKIQWQL